MRGDITRSMQAENELRAKLLFFKTMDRINRAVQSAVNLEEMMQGVLGEVFSIFNCDRVFLIYPCDPESPIWSAPIEISKPEYPRILDLKQEMPMSQHIAGIFRILLNSDGPVKFVPGTDSLRSTDFFDHFQLKSSMSMALFPKEDKPWQFGIQQCAHARDWTEDEERLLQGIGRRLEDGLTAMLAYRNLKESEAMYRRIVGMATEGLWVLGPNTFTTFVNARMAQMLGYSVDEILGRPVTDFMFEEDVADHERRMENRRQGKSEYYERRLRHRDGRTLWTHASATPIFDNDHQFNGAFAILTDISKYKYAQISLNEQLHFLQQLLDSIPIPVFYKDLEGKYLGCNMAFEAFTGFSRKDILGKTVYDISSGNRADKHHKIDLALFSKPGKRIYEVRANFLKKKYKNIIFNKATYVDANGRVAGIVGALVDITQRKQVEEKIRKFNQTLERRVTSRTAELQAVNKELEAFAYTVSHDLRSPLRHIEGFIELLQNRAGNGFDEKSLHYMDVVSNSAKKMGQLIDTLLSFSRMGRQEMVFQQINLNSLVNDVISELSPDTAGRDIEWRIGELPSVKGDASMLKIVLVNLISNALKFTLSRQQAKIEIGSLPTQTYETVIFVRDNGVGFDMVYKEKLFCVFQRLHRADEFEGTGIGLATVQRTLARHGGRTWAEGEPGQGATFYISLP